MQKITGLQNLKNFSIIILLHRLSFLELTIFLRIDYSKKYSHFFTFSRKSVYKLEKESSN